jgi:hypothetical protein
MKPDLKSVVLANFKCDNIKITWWDSKWAKPLTNTYAISTFVDRHIDNIGHSMAYDLPLDRTLPARSLAKIGTTFVVGDGSKEDAKLFKMCHGLQFHPLFLSPKGIPSFLPTREWVRPTTLA